MSLLRGSDYSSARVSGNNSGVYTGISGALSSTNNGVGAAGEQYGHQLAGIHLLTPMSVVTKRSSPDLHYPAARKQQRTDQAPWISGYTLPSRDLAPPSLAYQQSSRVVCEESIIRSRLQELERELLDDDQDAGLESEIVDAGLDWEETMQSLISSASTSSPPLAFSSSPPSACSSTSPAPTDSKQLLLDSLVALSEGRRENAIAGITRVRQLCNPCGSDTEHRLLAHIARAIDTRTSPPEVRPPGSIELSSSENLLSHQMLFESSPCFKLGFMAANFAILDAIADRNRIHIIDFDIRQGNQYGTLIQALAERKSGPPASLRITAVVVDANSGRISGLRVVGERLEKLAERFGIRCIFHVLGGCRVGELDQERLGCSIGDSEEAVAVNFAYRLYRVADESVSTENQRDEMLRLVRGLNPAAVVVVEQVMNGNTAPLVARFGEVFSHYRALFDSLDATMVGVSGSGKNAEERFKLEEFLGKRAANAVACEGRDRVERCEVAGKWMARLEMAGFRPRLLPPHVQSSFLSKLKSYRKPGFTFKEEAGGICFGWNDRLLTYASSWH